MKIEMTEEQAKEKLCPYLRHTITSVNVSTYHNCCASSCMAWALGSRALEVEDGNIVQINFKVDPNDPRIRQLGYCSLTHPGVD